MQNRMAAAFFGVCGVTVIAAILGATGTWPFQPLSIREPGFDRFENLVIASPLILLLWITFAFARKPR